MSLDRAVALGRCYGRFIAWRDSLYVAMNATDYVPAADAQTRFEAVETAFLDTMREGRKLEIKVVPTFAETDLPPDVRDAFRLGFDETNLRLRDPRFEQAQFQIVSAAGASNVSKMSRLQTNIEAAFADLGQPCDLYAASKSSNSLKHPTQGLELLASPQPAPIKIATLPGATEPPPSAPAAPETAATASGLVTAQATSTTRP